MSDRFCETHQHAFINTCTPCVKERIDAEDAAFARGRAAGIDACIAAVEQECGAGCATQAIRALAKPESPAQGACEHKAYGKGQTVYCRICGAHYDGVTWVKP